MADAMALALERWHLHVHVSSHLRLIDRLAEGLLEGATVPALKRPAKAFPQLARRDRRAMQEACRREAVIRPLAELRRCPGFQESVVSRTPSFLSSGGQKPSGWFRSGRARPHRRESQF